MLTIIGCGNPYRSDDAVGVEVAQRLLRRLARDPLEGVVVIDAGTAGVEVMLEARGSDRLVVIDACVGSAAPGTIVEVPTAMLAELPRPSFSTHDLRWHHAVVAGRTLFPDEVPGDVRVWLVEAASVERGTELSPSVRVAADTLVERAWALMTAAEEGGMRVDDAR